MLPTMGSLYDEDLVLWSKEQARALREAARAGWNAPIDWENVAEEIESLGRSDRRALASHIATVIEHLLKLQAAPARDPVRGWMELVRRARREVERLLTESPSLRRELPKMIADELPAARKMVEINLHDHAEQPLHALDQLTYTEDQILGDWLPPAA